MQNFSLFCVSCESLYCQFHKTVYGIVLCPVFFSTCVEKEMKIIPSYSIAEAFFCEKTKQKHNSIDVCLEFVLHSNLKLVKGAVGNT